MIQNFADKETEKLFRTGMSSKYQSFGRIALRKLVMINAAVDVKTLNIPPGNRLEMLKGDRNNQYSIRINDQWRVCFRWQGTDARDVEIVDYH